MTEPNDHLKRPGRRGGHQFSTLGVNIVGAIAAVGLFLFVNPVAGTIAALVFGVIAIRLAKRR